MILIYQILGGKAIESLFLEVRYNSFERTVLITWDELLNVGTSILKIVLVLLSVNKIPRVGISLQDN